MSIKASEKEKIMIYLLNHIDRNDRDYAIKTMQTFGVSRTTVTNYVKQLVKDQIIVSSCETECGYELTCTIKIFSYSTSTKLEEDRIFNNDILPLVVHLSPNTRDILRYVFTEMMNNAIEHSSASTIQCTVIMSFLNTGIMINDDGIGIFKKIQDYFANKGENISIDEAVEALFPGKLTTDEKNHSGEGIFFSSRAADAFGILSSGKLFAHNNFNERIIDITDIEYAGTTNGTCVVLQVANNSPKRIKDVFDMYSNAERGFFKTQIPIAHMFSSGYPVSRSEARRLATLVSGFEEITLDFKDVPEIGQAFTHELFVVFQNQHPEIIMNTVNTCKDVDDMITRVKNTKR